MPHAPKPSDDNAASNNIRADMLKRMSSQSTLGKRPQLSGALQREIADDEVVDLATILKDAPPMPDIPLSLTSQASPEVSPPPKSPENSSSTTVAHVDPSRLSKGKAKKKRKPKNKNKEKSSDPSANGTEESKEDLQSWNFMNKKAKDPPVTKTEKSSPGLQQKEEKNSEEKNLDVITMKLRQQLANLSGFCYNPNYEHAHLRSAPIPEKPAPANNEAAPANDEFDTEPEGTKTPTNKGKETSAVQEMSLIGLGLDLGGKTPTNKGNEAPAIQETSLIGLGLDMGTPSTVKRASSVRSSFNSDDTSTPPDEPSSPTRFLQPLKPVEVSPMTLFPPYHASQESMTPKQLLSDPVHPWADLWTKFSKPADFKLSEDPEDLAAYTKIRNELIECWMVATGQKNAPSEVLHTLSAMLFAEEKLRKQNTTLMPPSEPASMTNSPVTASSSFTSALNNSHGRKITPKRSRTFDDSQLTPISGVQSTINTPPSKSVSFPVETSVTRGSLSPRFNTTRKASNSERPRLALTPQTPMTSTLSEGTKGSKSAPLYQMTFEKSKSLKSKRSFSFASSNKNKEKMTPTLSATNMFFKKGKSSRRGSITSEESLLNKHLDDLLYAVNAWYTTGGQKSQENPITLLAQMALKIAQSVMEQANARFSAYLYTDGSDDEDGGVKMPLVQENMTRQIESLLNRVSMDEASKFTNPSPLTKSEFSHDYLQAGYECTWAVRFYEWAEEQEELCRFIDQEEDRIHYGAGGPSENLRKSDRTKELMEKLSWVTYSSQPDYATNMSIEVAEQRLQRMRAENYDQDDLWMKCEEQLCKLTGLISSV